MIETELSFKVNSFPSFPAKAKKLFCGKETNILFDFPDRRMQKMDSVVRLRKQGCNVFVTFKGPCRGTGFKERIETEFQADSFSVAKKFLESIGLRSFFVYEKKKKEYLFNGCRVSFLIFPFIGKWVELEGNKKAIKKSALKLGLDFSNGISKSFPALFKEHRKKYCLKEKNMVF
jgi:predicted adenylyl cyclase CyaB